MSSASGHTPARSNSRPNSTRVKYCTKRQQVPFKGAAGSYGPLLSRSTHLMSSTDYIPGDAQVTIRNTAEYAQYHNEGAESTVTL